MVKGLKMEDKLEATDLDKRGNRSETTDSVEQFDSDKPNHLKAKQKRRKSKPTLKGRNRRVDER